MPFVASSVGARTALRGAFRAGVSRARPLRTRCPPQRRAPVATTKSKSKRKDGVPPVAESVAKPTRREVINRLLSSRASLVVVGVAMLLYILVMALIAHRIASISLAGHERILLTALAVLLPDFRYVLQTYLGAVSELKRYRPPTFPFEFAKSSSSKSKTVEARPVPEGVISPLDAPVDTATEMLANLRTLVDAELAKANSIISEKVEAVTRDMTRPLMETSTTIQQMTIGTDLTLRKNVLVAAITIFLSLLGYFACAAGEVVIGCVVVMIATLLPSAILAPRRHELLILINDARVFLSLFGTLSAVLCAFLPLTAAYFFFGACVGLVTVRANV